eukprot:1157234-Pelagomonas_calceolata.AAC.10
MPASGACARCSTHLLQECHIRRHLARVVQRGACVEKGRQHAFMLQSSAAPCSPDTCSLPAQYAVLGWHTLQPSSEAMTWEQGPMGLRQRRHAEMAREGGEANVRAMILRKN